MFTSRDFKQQGQVFLVSLPLLLINESINKWKSLHRDEMNQQTTEE